MRSGDGGSNGTGLGTGPGKEAPVRCTSLLLSLFNVYILVTLLLPRLRRSFDLVMFPSSAVTLFARDPPIGSPQQSALGNATPGPETTRCQGVGGAPKTWLVEARQPACSALRRGLRFATTASLEGGAGGTSRGANQADTRNREIIARGNKKRHAKLEIR